MKLSCVVFVFMSQWSQCASVLITTDRSEGASLYFYTHYIYLSIYLLLQWCHANRCKPPGLSLLSSSLFFCPSHSASVSSTSIPCVLSSCGSNASGASWTLGGTGSKHPPKSHFSSSFPSPSSSSLLLRLLTVASLPLFLSRLLLDTAVFQNNTRRIGINHRLWLWQWQWKWFGLC